MEEHARQQLSAYLEYRSMWSAMLAKAKGGKNREHERYCYLHWSVCDEAVNILTKLLEAA